MAVLKMKKIIYKNHFHNTEAKIIPKPAENGWHFISNNQLKRLTNKLCGMEDCSCSLIDEVIDPNNFITDIGNGYLHCHTIYTHNFQNRGGIFI